MEVVKHFKSIGAVWGGDWKFKDKPHFEITLGHTWRTLKTKLDKGDTFTEVINGVKYTYVNL
jgi:predicted RecB family nuclease